MSESRRRYKSFQADTGISYQYFFAFDRRVVRPEGQGEGTDFVFVAIADQAAPFVLRVFLADRALEAWNRAHGRGLSSSEQYAAAKLRLFRGFDEEPSLDEKWLELVVDETNLEELLGPLELA
jgi:hypothetical protein